MTQRRNPCPPLVLPHDRRAEIARHARRAYPREACGLLVGRHSGSTCVVDEVVRARNVLESRDRYELAPEDWLASWRDAESRQAEIVGVWHSHPDGGAEPSRADLRSAWPEYSYLIAAVSSSGVSDVRSWRLVDRAFSEQSVVAGSKP